MMRTYKTYVRFGFIITRSCGVDAPWRGWKDGVSFRADTLHGAFYLAKEYNHAN
jgi:hypothetical protein